MFRIFVNFAIGMFATQGQKKKKSAVTSSHLLIVLFPAIVVDANGNGYCCGFCVGLFVTGVSLFVVIIDLNAFSSALCGKPLRLFILLLAGSHSGVWALYVVFSACENGARTRVPHSNPVTDARLFLDFYEIAESLGMMRVRWVEAIVVVVIGNLS